MKNRFFGFVIGAAVSAAALPASAEVSAQDVWSDWKAMLATISQGGEISASEQLDGNTLVVSDLAFGASSDKAGYAFSTDEIRFTENGDGTVTVTMSPEMSISFSADVEEFSTTDLTVTIRQDGLVMTASGNPEKVEYVYKANAINSDFSAEVGDSDDLGMIAYAVAMTGVSGTYTSDQTEGYASQGEMLADVMDVVSEMGEVGGEAIQTTRTTVRDISSWFDISVPEDFSLEDPKALVDGLASFKAGYRSAGQSMHMEMIQDGLNLVVNGEAAVSSSEFAFDNNGIDVKGDVAKSTYVVQASGVPFPPVEISLESALFEAGFPLYAKSDAQDFRLKIRLDDLAVSDQLWAMVDPMGGIPRVPATIVLDVDGKVHLLANMVDPEALEDVEDLPVLLQNMNVNEIQLAMAGAKILADGGFVFDNDDLDTFDGMPAPEGKLNVTASGVITLMDTLVQMGLVPQDQAMGAQMMMSLFMRPSEGEDTWVSEVEVHKDGSVFSNGQQLK